MRDWIRAGRVSRVLFALLLLWLLPHAGRAQGLDAYPDSWAGLENPTNRVAARPASDRLFVRVGFSSVMLESTEQPDDVAARNPDNSLRGLTIGWMQRAGERLDYGVELRREDGAGWLLAGNGWLRFGLDEDAPWISFGLGLLQTVWDERSLRPMVRYGAGLGSDWGSHAEIVFENMGPIPIAPGFSVAENSGLRIRGQFDLGGLALWGGFVRSIRSAGEDARLVMELAGGLAFTGPKSRLAFGWELRQGAEARYVADGEQEKLDLRRVRQIMGLTLSYAFARVNAAGYEDRHAFMLAVYPGQQETVMDAPDWSSGRPEFAFEWSASFGL